MRWILVVLVVTLIGCASAYARPINLPPPVEVTALGPGDIFEMEIIDEDSKVREYTIAPDGTVDVPYIEGLKVEGLEQQEIAAAVRKALIDREILTQPRVLVSIKEFKSKRVVVSGQVKAESSLTFRTGMTLRAAISEAGGLTPLAKRGKIGVTRQTKGGEKTDYIDYDAIIRGLVPDPLLQAGDKIDVQQRVF